MTKVRLIGVGLDLGSGRRGVDMGPSAIRVAGLENNLESLGHVVEDWGDMDAAIAETIAVGDAKMRFVDAVLDVNKRLAVEVQKSFSEGYVPIILGGDHSIAIGVIAGASAHFQAKGEEIGVVWIDAHGDMNTPRTSPSGNIHGMPLAISLGIGDPRFVDLLRPGRKISPSRVALVGIRDLDPGEKELLVEQEVSVFDMRDIDEQGMFKVMEQAIAIASSGTAGIHVEFDMDALDPSIAPGTGTPVKGGLTYREAHLAMEMLHDTGKVLSMDIVETNPALDIRNQTAVMANELILSLLGKQIIEWSQEDNE